MAKQADVISHWYRLIENFQTSSMGFYQSLERAVEERFVPQAHSARVEHKESGLASANRIYLRFHRGRYAFDICAAQFGTGFFVSWWFTEPPLRFAILYTLAFVIGLLIGTDLLILLGFGIGFALDGYTFGVVLGAGSALFGVPAWLWVLGHAIREGKMAGESTVLAMPLIGWIYERIFAPATYYSLDTAFMFQEAVHNAVLEVIDCLTTQNGVRALSEAERKPILKRFAASA